jgi:hypothetical protein
METISIACPHCRATLKGKQAPRPGQKTRCPRCRASFAITPKVLPPAPPPPPPVPALPVAIPAPIAAGPQPGKVSAGRLGLVLAGAVLYLGLGAALGAYCFTVNRSDAANNRPEPGSPAGPAAAPEPPLVTVSPAEQARINQAVSRALRFLKTSQSPTGTWPGDGGHPIGYAALPALTLLEGGVPMTDPTVQKAVQFVREHGPACVNTYELALAILFLDRLGDPRDRELIRTFALRLVAGQTTTGGWTYACPKLDDEDQKQLYEVLPLAEGLKYQGGPSKLRPALHTAGILQDLSGLTDASFANFTGDNSNTQFAALGLWAARKYDVPLDRTLALLERRFRNSQIPDGRWTYGPGSVVSQQPTMTCAGLLGLAVGLGLRSDTRPAGDAAIEKGFEVLAKTIGPPTGRTKDVPLVDLYYLWSLERVAVLYQRKTIGDKDWYAWGADMLLANQKDNGAWQAGNYPGSSPVIDTCFATLFLRQANLARDLTNKLQRLGGG